MWFLCFQEGRYRQGISMEEIQTDNVDLRTRYKLFQLWNLLSLRIQTNWSWNSCYTPKTWQVRFTSTCLNILSPAKTKSLVVLKYWGISKFRLLSEVLNQGQHVSQATLVCLLVCWSKRQTCILHCSKTTFLMLVFGLKILKKTFVLHC